MCLLIVFSCMTVSAAGGGELQAWVATKKKMMHFCTKEPDDETELHVNMWQSGFSSEVQSQVFQGKIGSPPVWTCCHGLSSSTFTSCVHQKYNLRITICYITVLELGGVCLKKKGGHLLFKLLRTLLSLKYTKLILCACPSSPSP